MTGGKTREIFVKEKKGLILLEKASYYLLLRGHI
jgi:hypothetical protein